MLNAGKKDNSIIFLIIIGFVFLIMIFIIFSQIKTDRIAEAKKTKETLSILFFISNNEELLFTEVYIFNSFTNKAAILDIPINTGMLIESEKKINSINVLYKKGKIFEYQKKVEDLLGIQIDYHIEININNIRNLVDLLEGIEIFNANPFESYENEILLMPAGNIMLDGDKLALYITFNSEDEIEADKIGRIQKFLQSFLKRTGDLNNEFQNDSLFNLFYKEFSTDLSRKNVQSLMNILKTVDYEKLIYQRVLGTIQDVDSKQLLFPHYQGNLIKETIAQIYESLKNIDNLDKAGLKINIEILNGTKINGLANRTSQVFKSFGYEVESLRNADNTDYEKTIVINRLNDQSAGIKVAEIIKCKQIKNELPVANIANQESGALNSNRIDITIILGNDFDGRYCKE